MKHLVNQWENIVQLVQNIGGEGHLYMDSVATENEIVMTERKLDIKLPLSLKEALLRVSKAIDVCWEFPDELIVPKPYKDNSFGKLQWNLHELEVLCDERDQKRLLIHHVGNGDLITIDVADDQPDGEVYYWYEDESTEYLLAKNVAHFLNNLTTLCLIGLEVEQVEWFLSSEGLCADNPLALKWIKWFWSLGKKPVIDYSTTGDILRLITHLGEIRPKQMMQLTQMDRSEVKQELLTSSLLENEWYRALLLGELFGSEIREWVLSLWEGADENLLKERSYLTAKCLPIHIGLPLVIKFVEEQHMTGYEAFHHLSYFRANDVIQWMTNYATLPFEGWDKLFAASNPTWEDLTQWLTSDEKRHMFIAINAIGALVSFRERICFADRLAYGEKPFTIRNLPNSLQVAKFFEEFKQTGRGRNRYHYIDAFLHLLTSMR